MKQVDVFTDRPLAGNPLAVVLDGQSLSTEEMQAIAKEMNLSETTFVLTPTKPEASYKVRIFTPGREMPFAGHPCIGTAHALMEDGKISLKEQLTTVRQEMGIGVLPIEIEQVTDRRRMITMTQGKPTLGRTITNVQELAQALVISTDEIAYNKLPVQVSSTGLNQLMVPFRSLEQVAALAPDYERLKEFEKRFQLEGCYAFALKASDPEASVHARFFIPSAGVPEDPATGSAAGALGAYLASHNVFASKTPVSFNIEQGVEIGRPSIITVTVHQHRGTPDIVKVGGSAVTVLNGEITL